jgi:hypothetical protein
MEGVEQNTPDDKEESPLLCCEPEYVEDSDSITIETLEKKIKSQPETNKIESDSNSNQPTNIEIEIESIPELEDIPKYSPNMSPKEPKKAKPRKSKVFEELIVDFEEKYEIVSGSDSEENFRKSKNLDIEKKKCKVNKSW